MKNKFILLIAALSLFSSTGWAIKEYYNTSRSTRAQGMGDAFYGWSNDESAMFYNPSGLSLYTGHSQGGLKLNAGVSSKTLSALTTLTKLGNDNIQTTVDKMVAYQGYPLSAYVGLLPFYFQKHFAIGLLVADTKVNVSLLGKELDSNVQVTALTDSGLYITYARPLFMEDLHFGATVKANYRAGGTKMFTLADISKKEATSIDPQNIGGAGGVLDFDLGATYVLPKVIPVGIEHRASLTLNNGLAMAPFVGKIGNKPPRLSRMLSLGWYSVFPGIWEIDNFHLVIDFSEFNLGGETDADMGARTGSMWKHVNFGVEAPIGILSVRAGFHQGNISAGLGVNLKVARIDLATYAEEDGYLPGNLTSRIYKASLVLGWTSAPTPPVSATGVTEDVKKLEEPKKETPKVEEKKPEAPASPRKPNEDAGETEESATPNP